MLESILKGLDVQLEVSAEKLELTQEVIVMQFQEVEDVLYRARKVKDAMQSGM